MSSGSAGLAVFSAFTSLFSIAGFAVGADVYKRQVLVDDGGYPLHRVEEIAGKVWKKEDELKQLKSEMCIRDSGYTDSSNCKTRNGE